ncbi:MAG: MmcQ/YjbR family DNA-binding protein [Eubacterium sp.]|nr:MmcQ/YjbR family DNA-binding protein [Eubacterium sp.]
MNRQEAIDYIKNEFNVPDEHLWMQFPEYAVFRNQKNNKWFALITDIDKCKLGLKGEGKISILNLKCDPILLASLLNNRGYLPAYHMSKKTWITVLLNGEAPEEQIKDLIHLSYDLIDKKK